MAGRVTVDNIADLAEMVQSGQPAITLTNHASTEKLVNLASVTTSGATVARAAGVQPIFRDLLKQYDVAVFMLNLTAAATEAGDTLDVYVDLSLDANTWFNAIHYTQMLGNGGAKIFVAELTHPTAGVADINVTSDAAANAVRNLWAPNVRVGYATTDANANVNAIFTFRLDCYLQAK
jgi:hypothetical protein